MRYVPLHVHSEYSLLDGAIRNKELIKFAKENNFEAVAVTDHGVMYGAMELYRQGKDQQFKVLLGCEFYVLYGDITKKDAMNRELYHLVLIAKNNTGYKNLVKLVSIAHIDGFYYKPRINREILEKHSEGLICLSACIAGEVASQILDGKNDEARETAKWYKNLFGEDYYIELQDHGLDEQKRSNPELIKIAKELDIPLVITNDSHYLRKEDASWHDTLLCIQTNALKEEENRFRFSNNQFYVKTPEELRESFRWMDSELFEEAIENTAKIADKCHVIIELGKSILPSFDVPEGHTIASYLGFKVRQGLHERYEEITPEIEERCKYELEIINKMGFDAYFLIVWDFINYAKTHGVPVGPGRGSAAGSLIAYALGITDLDPIKHHLFFERFLNPERISMPDVDIDFGDGRERVIEYVTEKYGKDKVCQIITFGTLSAKAAIKAVARVMNLPFEISNKVSQFVPSEVGMTIDKALEVSPDFKKVYDEDALIRQIIDEARNIEGLKQNTGMHAAGVIIAHNPLDEIVPVQYAKEGNVITEYPKEDCEKVGLLKMDFLGLKNLTIIVQTLDMIKKRHGIDIDINHIPLDDELTYQMLMTGSTDGVFQLESAGMKQLVKDLKPSVFEDLGALVALFRPGPLGSGMVKDFVERKHGRQEIKYAHPLLEPVLKDTYGTLVYQEQIMQIFQVLADYSLGGADGVRRIMAKKHPEDLVKLEGPFIEKAVSKGMLEKDAKELFDQIGSFASYCFNRSHSACYAFVAYQTAYLKAHYPVEYISAMLSNSKDDQAKTQLYISEAQKLGIKVLPPDINKSNAEFTPDGDNIRFGLNSIKGIGDAVLKEIEEEREKNGEFTSIVDFTQRINPRVVNRKTLENFAKAGAMTCLEPCRKKLFNNIDNILNAAARENEAKELGQVSLFAGLGGATGGNSYQMQSFELYGDDEEFTDKEIQEFEKEYLGFYVTSHPLESIRDKLPFLTTHNINDLEELPNDSFVTICGLLTSVRQIPTKKDPTKFLKAGVIEDLTGEIAFVAFHKTLQNYNSLIEQEKKIIMSGKLQKKEDSSPQIIVESIKPVENSNIVTITLNKNINFETIIAIKDELVNFKGSDPLIIKADNNGTEQRVLVSPNFWTNATNDLTQNLEKKFKDLISININSLE
ncbi:MAG: DNA polymerase III subunit alpha [Cyanobacteria bacterium SIG29]|nr:DNA polymerase III subunit alpha [Cyanobacteria bacterium SIG29]